VSEAASSASCVYRMTERWSISAEASQESGYPSVHAIPLRLRTTSLGSLNLKRGSEGGSEGGSVPNDADATAAQALAGVATISLLRERSLRETDVARAPLHPGLDSQVVIERAKGVISQRRGIDMDEALRVIREHARDSRTRLMIVAQSIVSRQLSL
jgi:hypothetical protein